MLKSTTIHPLTENMTPERFKKLTSVLLQRQLDLSVVMDKVHKGHNLSAIIRTCDAVGVHNVHAVTPDAGVRTSKDITSGSGKWINLHRHENIANAVGSVKNQNMRVYAAHLSASARDFRQIDFTEPCAILLGTELFGVSEEGLELADEHIIIPMLGMIDSLNVSVAAALILFEAQRQRLAAGIYDKQQLSETDFNNTLFEWSHPKLAEFYSRKNLAYPLLDEDGEVIESEVHSQARLKGSY